MAIGLYFSPANFSAAKYDECLKKLAKAGAGHPKGRKYHVSFGTPDKLMVFDIWDSQKSFDAFGKVLMPIMQEIGVDPGKPDIMPVHKVIVPPVAAKPAAAPKAASKPVAASKSVAKKSKPAAKASKAKPTSRGK